jgi:LuxR family transcriptional regulator, maltose regulon positive regulatory protein
VRYGAWRTLVREDAKMIDMAVRAKPDAAYDYAEQLRLPFAIERVWIEPVLRREPVLADAHQRLFAPALRPIQLPAPPAFPDQGTTLAIQPLTEREQEVLRHVARLLDTAEIASEMYISINAVKSHIKSIHRKLAATRRSDAVRRARELQLI